MGDNAAQTLDRSTVDGASPQTPQVFVRTFAVPPAAPWAQARAARLEVRHGAPLPLADLMHRVNRRSSWLPGQAGRFAAFYIRRVDYSAPFETIVEVDGDPVRVAFGRQVQDLGRLRSAATLGALIAVTAVAIIYAAAVALAARSDANGRLDTLSRQVATRLAAGHAAQDRRTVAAALAEAQGRGGLASDVLDDLAWVARAKTPDSKFLAVHWDHGLVAVESHGAAAPLSGGERAIVRASHPIRPGVWLWGARRAGDAASLPGSAPP